MNTAHKVKGFSQDVPAPLRDLIAQAITPMHGWCTEKKALSLANLILTAHPTTVVEIGVFGGRSLLPMAMALREDMRGGIVYGIDPWRVEHAVEGDLSPEDKDWWGNKVPLGEVHDCCMRELWKHDLERWVCIIRSASQFVPRLFPSGIDLLHVDGTHSNEASCRDIKLYLPQVSFGGFVLFDDSNWATTQKAQAMLAQECDRLDIVDDCVLFRRRKRVAHNPK